MPKEFNIKRHYESKHAIKFAEFSGELRKFKINNLRKQLIGEQSIFGKVTLMQRQLLRLVSKLHTS